MGAQKDRLVQAAELLDLTVDELLTTLDRTAGPERINGFVVVADRTSAGARIILAVIDRADGHREYVTAVTEAREAAPTTWLWGHYFHTTDPRAFERAARDFDNR